jgi:hypothetical protein
MVPAARTSPDEAVVPGITWETEVPLLSRDVIGTTIAVFVIAALISGSLISAILWTQGEPDAILPIFGMLGVASAALAGVGLLATALLFRGDMRFRFSVTDEGIRSELIDRTARTVNRLTIVAGMLAGRPGAVGTGLVATSGEDTALSWRGGFRAAYDPRRRTITLRNGWRRLLVLHCTEQNYVTVAAFVGARITASGTDRRVPSHSPLPRMLARTGVVVAASLVVLPLADVSEVSTLLILIMLCFAIAMIWLVSLFGYVVLGSIALVVGSVIADALSVQESYLHPGETYRRLSVFSDNDFLVLGVAGIGMTVLGVLAFRAIRGRLPSMLERDADTMGG